MSVDVHAISYRAHRRSYHQKLRSIYKRAKTVTSNLFCLMLLYMVVSINVENMSMSSYGPKGQMRHIMIALHMHQSWRWVSTLR